MMHVLSRRRHGALLACAVLSVAMAGSATGAQIWERAGPFQACIESRFEKWVHTRTELVVNEDPKAGDIDDASVARWTAETIDACRAQAGGGDQESEARFTKHMSRWRDHIYDLVRNIQERVRPD